MTRLGRLALATLVIAGSAALSTQAPATATEAACTSTPDQLENCYNNVGVTPDDDTSAGNFDGDYNSYSASALADAAVNKATPGAPIVSSGIRFTFPEYGQDSSGAAKRDNLVPQGQTIILPDAEGATKLGFLLSAGWGSRTENVTVDYTDDTTQNFAFEAPDWQSPSGTVAVNSAYRNRPGSSQEYVNTYIYSQTVDLDPDRTVESVTLPDSGPPEHGKATMHIFDIATGNTVTVSDPGNQSSAAGTPVNLQIEASDSAPDQDLTYSATGLPAGLSIDPDTGVISGSPTEIGESTVAVTATDTTGSSGSANFTWSVTATCRVNYTQKVGNPPYRGYTARAEITNIGSTPINGWTLRFAFRGDQSLFMGIGARVETSGQNVRATNTSYAPTIAPGATAQRITLLGRYRTSYEAPNIFTLNGVTCADNIA
ncbi:putative Ig domain-containing protein [Streptomyces sp. NPDC050658]|uniref:putative Ig domain-containing protein n=1 Tax=unclassified Streptomyces TaxID=2593676 RepID=UPI003448F50C